MSDLQINVKSKMYLMILVCLNIIFQPNNEKALYRKSKVYEEKGRSDECLGLLRRITRLYPENKSARADLARMTAKQRKNKEQEFRDLGLLKPNLSQRSEPNDKRICNLCFVLIK